MLSLRTTLLAIGGVGFAYGIFRFYRTQALILQDITFKVKKVDVIESSYQNVKLLITLSVINPSEINFTITGYDLDVLVNGAKVSEVNNSKLNERVEGMGQNSRVQFYATFSPQQILETDLIVGVLSNLANTNIRVIGKVGISKFGFPFPDYPLDLSLKLQDFI
mgnify:CR=1 FL=1